MARASEPARGGGLTFSPRELSSELVSVAVEWQDLGLRLGLQPWQLSRVEHEHSSCRERLAACLDAWVRSKEGASWGDVVASLKEMGEHALAMKVEDGHCGVATRRPDLSSPPQNPSSPQGTRLLTAAAEENYTTMMGRFSQLQVLVCSRIQQQLQANAISSDELVLYVKTLFSPGDCIPHTANVAELFIAITRNRFWNFMHCDKLAKVAGIFLGGDGEVKSQLMQYTQNLAKYKATTKMVDYVSIASEPTDIGEPEEIEELASSLRPACKDHRYFCDITVKIRVTVTTQSLSYIDELWGSLSTLFLIPPSTAILDKILTGSLYISWLIPSHCIPQVMEGVQRLETQTFFHQSGIVLFAVGGVRIYTEAATLQGQRHPESIFIECEKCSQRILKKNEEDHLKECQGSATESASVIPRLDWLDNFNRLCSLLQPVSSRWFELARELRVRIQPQSDPFTNVLRQWLSRKQAPTRKELARALENMGAVDLAVKVRSQLFSSAREAESPSKGSLQTLSPWQYTDSVDKSPSGTQSLRPSSAGMLRTPSPRQHNLIPNNHSTPPAISVVADPSLQTTPSLTLQSSYDSVAVATNTSPIRGILKYRRAASPNPQARSASNPLYKNPPVIAIKSNTLPRVAKNSFVPHRGHFSPSHNRPPHNPTSPPYKTPPALLPYVDSEGFSRRTTNPPLARRQDPSANHHPQFSPSLRATPNHTPQFSPPHGTRTAPVMGSATSATYKGATAMLAGTGHGNVVGEGVFTRSVGKSGHSVGLTRRQSTRL